MIILGIFVELAIVEFSYANIQKKVYKEKKKKKKRIVISFGAIS